MVLAESVKFKHGLCKSCGIEWFEGIMLEPCLLQPCFHVAGGAAEREAALRRGGDASAAAAAALPRDSFGKTFACGSIAGFAQSFIICPMEHIKCRLQVQHGAGAADSLYRGPFDALYKIVTNHGISGLFRGMCVTWWREIPAFGLYFSTYDYIKDTGNRLFANENGEVKDWHAWGASAFAGGTSGCFTWLVICKYFTVVFAEMFSLSSPFFHLISS